MHFETSVRKTVSTGLALMAGVGIGAVIDQEAGLVPHHWPFDTPTCPTPSSSAMETTDQLLSRPPLDLNLPYSKETYRESKAEIAQRYNLILPDNNLAHKLGANLYDRPFKWDFTVAGAYLAQFGVKLSVAGPHEFDEGTGTMPTEAQLDNPSAQYMLADIVTGFRSLPLQYVRATGLKHIVLTDITDPSTEALALTNESADNTVLVDPSNGGQGSLMPHEIEHLIDEKECGGSWNMQNDTAYTSLNGGDIYNNGDTPSDNHEITLTDEIGTYYDKAIYTTNNQVGCENEEKLKKALSKTVAFSDYGLTNPAEDKAELAENIAFPSRYAEVLNPSTPIIRKKFEIIMARLYEINPRLVRYFAGVSTRPDGAPNREFSRDCPADKQH